VKKTRILIQLDKAQLAALRKIRAATGASIAEIIRRMIDADLRRRGK